MDLKTPAFLKLEHKQLHSQLAEATRAGGNIGEAARTVARTWRLHFVKEEEYAFPPLRLLPLLAQGTATTEMAEAFVMTDRLKAELNQMLEEHREIVAALTNLINVAKQENKIEYVKFAERLVLHAKSEEEVLYPAAILVGEYLRFKLKK
ncbi:MAG TPA: hemerythrin domain-containing protein [Terriglobales bacterium]|nr:hemerythrin domain-containing protein [Terriglobales bacterium]